MEVIREGNDIIQVVREKKKTKILYAEIIHFKNEEEIKIFSNK